MKNKIIADISKIITLAGAQDIIDEINRIQEVLTQKGINSKVIGKMMSQLMDDINHDTSNMKKIFSENAEFKFSISEVNGASQKYRELLLYKLKQMTETYISTEVSTIILSMNRTNDGLLSMPTGTDEDVIKVGLFEIEELVQIWIGILNNR